MSVYTSGEYLAKNPSWHAEDSAWKAQQILRVLTKKFLTKHFPNAPFSIVDIGCGAGGVLGNLLEMLRARKIDVAKALGIDISEDAIALARKNWPEIEFRVRDITSFSDAEPFDIGLVMDVVEHIADYEAFIKSLRGSCRFFVFHIPLDDNLNNVLRHKFESLEQEVGHVHYFDVVSVRHMLKDYGFKVISEVYTPVFQGVPSGTALNNLARFPRSLCYRISPGLTAKIMGGASLLVLAR